MTASTLVRPTRATSQTAPAAAPVAPAAARSRTRSAPTAPARSGELRLVVLPDPEPPLDPPGMDGALALAEALARRGSRPALRLVPAPPAEPLPGPPPPGPRDADLARHARGLVVAVLEALAGRRPLPQLAREMSPDVHADLARWVRTRRRAPLPLVRSVHVSRPVEGAAEVCAVVGTGRAVGAVALRLEEAAGRWRCTALEMR